MPDKPKPTMGLEQSSIQNQFNQLEASGGGSFQAATPPQEPVTAPGIPKLGGEGQPPLPIGQPVTIDPKGLTPMERADLSSIGWKDGDPVPSNLGQHFEEARERSHREATQLASMPPPASPDLPPLKMPEEVDIEQLPEHERIKLREALQEAGNVAEQMERDRVAMTSTIEPGTRDAAAGKVHREVPLDLEDDREETREARVAELGEHTVHQTDDEMKACPHCGWELALQDGVKVTEKDKLTFLQATLGNVPWQHLFSLMNNNLQVTFRQLRPAEVDACFSQSFYERDQQGLDQMSFLEQINRYRLTLQLVDIRSAGKLETFPVDLAGWKGKPINNNPTVLPEVLGQVYDRVMGTESINRILSLSLGSFNRLVVKLEANIENPDFWPKAEPQT